MGHVNLTSQNTRARLELSILHFLKQLHILLYRPALRRSSCVHTIIYHLLAPLCDFPCRQRTQTTSPSWKLFGVRLFCLQLKASCLQLSFSAYSCVLELVYLYQEVGKGGLSLMGVAFMKVFKFGGFGENLTPLACPTKCSTMRQPWWFSRFWRFRRSWRFQS